MSSRRTVIMATFAAAATAVVVALPSILNGFVYDDVWIVRDREVVHSLRPLGELLAAPFWPEARGGDMEKEGDYDDDSEEEPFRSLLAYKARPLNGIWATAPYLHNGSVPNLYELLLPASSRSKKFRVGRREFDPVRVGFATGEYPPGFGSELDTTIAGNRNTGHEYGTDLSEDDRMALVEYLKSL